MQKLAVATASADHRHNSTGGTSVSTKAMPPERRVQHAYCNAPEKPMLDAPAISNSFSQKWHEKSMKSSCVHVPQKSGIYVIGHVWRYSGLEESRKYLYIGESGNLQKRLEEHGPRQEPKEELRRYIQENLDSIKCWYRVLPEGRRKSEQNLLIKRFAPQFNVQHNPQRRRP